MVLFSMFSSNFKTLLSEGITTLELSLYLTPLVTELVPLRTNLLSDNVLILGKSYSAVNSVFCKLLT